MASSIAKHTIQCQDTYSVLSGVLKHASSPAAARSNGSVTRNPARHLSCTSHFRPSKPAVALQKGRRTSSVESIDQIMLGDNTPCLRALRSKLKHTNHPSPELISAFFEVEQAQPRYSLFGADDCELRMPTLSDENQVEVSP